MTKTPVVLACVEGGGTSFRLAVAHRSSASSGIPTILHQTEIDSSHNEPTITLQECVAFFQKYKPAQGYHALGLATFGPVGLDATNMNTYGHILESSPKAVWRNVDFLTPLKKACQGDNGQPLAILVETDVNAPALAEYCKHNLDVNNNKNKKISSVAYITVGTGVGVGLCVHGSPVHGRMHPEGGHVPVQPLAHDPFEGYSWGSKAPFGGKQTVEGIASSIALLERLALEQNVPISSLPRSALSELPDDHGIWDHAANALANLCTTLLLVTSVEKIVLGGGVMKRKLLLEKIQQRTIELINDYIDLPKDNMSELICKSDYGDQIGLVGALVLAEQAFLQEERQEKNARDDAARTATAFHVGVIHGLVLGSLVTLAGFAWNKQRRI